MWFYLQRFKTWHPLRDIIINDFFSVKPDDNLNNYNISTKISKWKKKSSGEKGMVVLKENIACHGVQYLPAHQLASLVLDVGGFEAADGEQKVKQQQENTMMSDGRRLWPLGRNP